MDNAEATLRPLAAAKERVRNDYTRGILRYILKMTSSRCRTPLSDTERQEIADRYAAGDTLAALSAAYGRSRGVIKRAVTESGIEIRPRGYTPGRQWTPEWRDAHQRGVNTPENRERSRKALLERLPSVRGPAANTPIERRLHGALRVCSIGFTTQSLLLGRHLVDIEIRQAPIVIEADGSQHTLRVQKAKDAVRDTDLTAAGYRVFRFTGSEINRDASACVQRVIDECNLIPDQSPVYDVRTRFAGELHPLWKGGPREFTCEQCGSAFMAQPKHRAGKRVFCGSRCYGDSRRGKPLSAEHRRKIAEGMMHS